MATPSPIDWVSETIPDGDRLFYRINSKLLKDGITLQPGVFREQHGSMSTDWEKYSTPEQARMRAAIPADNGIVALVAGTVRSVEGLTVEHSPDLETKNRAHTDVFGLNNPDGVKKNAARVALLNHVREVGWVISPDADV